MVTRDMYINTDPSYSKGIDPYIELSNSLGLGVITALVAVQAELSMATAAACPSDTSMVSGE